MIQFPKHKCGLYLTHNQHKDYYENIHDYAAEHDFKNEESKQRAFNLDELWELQWYPNIPTSFYSCSAPTIEEVLNFALEIERDYLNNNVSKVLGDKK